MTIGISAISAPALKAFTTASNDENESLIARMSNASVMTNPSKPIWFRNKSVKMGLEKVAGVMMVSPVFVVSFCGSSAGN